MKRSAQQHPASRLSPAIEDYLKAIYKLQAGEAVSTSAIAGALEISAASVTNMTKRMAEMGLVEYTSYRGVTLTPAGTKVALEVIRHHRLLELYLKEVLGYSWAELHAEAERLEHHISETFERKLDELLRHPTHDPHGHPIPTPEGVVAEASADPLSDVRPGRRVTVCHLADDDPALLSHLEERGLMPGAMLEILERAPFDGPLTIRIGDDEQVIGQAVAQCVFVRVS